MQTFVNDAGTSGQIFYLPLQSKIQIIGGSKTYSVFAPFLTASLIYLLPFMLVPFIAKKILSFLTVELLKANPEKKTLRYHRKCSPSAFLLLQGVK